MTAQLLMPARAVAEAVLTDVAERVAKLRAADVSVGLGTILVGDDAASASYIKKKHEACDRVGMLSLHQELPTTATQSEVDRRHRPLQRRPHRRRHAGAAPPSQGLDYNAALLAHGSGEGRGRSAPHEPGQARHGGTGADPVHAGGDPGHPRSTTASTAEGKHVVVMGRGTTLGRPVSLLLSQKAKGANAAVTVVHTGVPDWGAYTRQADIVIAAAPCPASSCPSMSVPEPWL